jgi:thiosulfate dehydrogenase [quinone] large subunit
MMQQLVQPISQLLYGELRKPTAYLLPVRIFIAAGWLRASAEKMVDPGWRTGEALTVFFIEQLANNQAPFGFYQKLITTLFLPNAQTLSWIILLGQLAVGIGLGFGLFTRAALLGGLFMNINFLLAGRPDPSAFYLVIQTILLVGDADKVFSVDSLFARVRFRQQESTQVASPPFKGILVSAVCAFCFAVVAIYAYVHISHFSPDASVEDAAAVLCVLAIFGLGLSLVAFVRQLAPQSLSLVHQQPTIHVQRFTDDIAGGGAG